MSKKNCMYNYLTDAMNIDFTSEVQYKICDSTKSNCKVKATICGKCYQDPDEVSQKLYEDLKTKFGEIFENGLWVARKKSQWYLKLDDLYEHELSTDYIGPSRVWALKYLEGDNDEKAKKIGEFLLISRTIGGHVFWPAHQVSRQKTINQVKGGKSIYDRFDFTLAELKNFYDTKSDNQFLYYEPLYKAFQRYKWFFEKFDSFHDYVCKMKLDNFLHNGEVISLLDSDLEKGNIQLLTQNSECEPLNYDLYIKNCNKLIVERTKQINQKK